MMLQMLELVEFEIRDLLNAFDFDGDNIPVVIGSALLALNGDTSEIGNGSIHYKLLVHFSYSFFR